MILQELVSDATHGDSLRALIEVLREARFNGGVSCPHCGGRRVHRWGTFAGRQRYRCLDQCRRTFSDFTGTPAAYIKKVSLWPDYGSCLAEGISLRASARRMQVHPSTAFRWRHRLLGWLAQREPDLQIGLTELTLLRFVESRKGERGLDRVPRRRRMDHQEWLLAAKARVLVACDRTGRVASTVLTCFGAQDERDEITEFIQRVKGDNPTKWDRVVAADRQLISWALLARPRPVGLLDVMDRRSPMAPLATVRRARAYGLRLRRWMVRFRGVATRHLWKYLAWHRHHDAEARHGVGIEALRWTLEPP